MFHKTLTAFLLTCYVDSLLACWGSSHVEEDPKIKKDLMSPDNVKLWNGWSPPPGAPAAWSKWKSEYNSLNLGKGGAHDPELHGKYPYGHNIKGWPPDWAGLGPPHAGMAPPPWAYVPKNTGKPSFCYDPPVYGNCDKEINRFGYNGFMDECQTFVYSGCGGNRNNFAEQISCQKACMATPETGCENDSKLPIDSFVWSRRCGYSDDEPSDYVDVRNY